MTYGEVKQQIRDYGFDDDSTMQEYATIVKNAVNDAVQFIFDGIVIPLKGYYKHELSRPDDIPPFIWTPIRPQYITDDTEDNFVIELPDNIVQLVALLASHYVWLDDDVQKAQIYWNDFDTWKNEIMTSCLKDVKGTITGGIGW